MRLTLALTAVLTTTSLASAGWDNVFQVTCNRCKDRTSNFAPAPVQRTEYIQRSYYEPVTVMQRQTFYTPVQEQVKSYYYEPVTSYRYSTYYDPCSGCPQEVATPVTSYRMREKCDTVTRYLEQTRMVPVEARRLVTTTQPVVTTYYPPTVTRGSLYTPSVEFAAPQAPRVDELRATPPGVMPAPATTPDSMLPKQNLPTDSNFYGLPRSNEKKPIIPARTASLRGEVLENDRRTPRGNARLVFVNPLDNAKRVSANTNSYGEFDVNLPAGDWYVYLGTGDGKAVYHKKVTVREYDNPTYRVVSR